MRIEIVPLPFPIWLVEGEVYNNSVGVLRVFNAYLPSGFEAVASVKGRSLYVKAYFDLEDIEEAEFSNRDLRDVVLTWLYHYFN